MSRRLVAARLIGALVMLAAPVGVPAVQEEPPPVGAQPAKLSADQLDAMVAPIALYPDPLLIQVMVASTYPLEVVEADRWRRGHADLKGDALDKALESQDWDPSVEGLTQFPDLLKRMSENLDWTKDLGDAFLAQKDDVLDAVQQMRRRAQDAGTLQTSKEQTVVKEVVREKETIAIEPADPEVVYAPTYAPSAVYGSYEPPAPYYPAMYGYAPGYTTGQMVTTGLLSFGAGVATGALIGGACNWGDRGVYVGCHGCGYGGGGGWRGPGNVNVNRNTNVNVNKQNVVASGQKWEHNSAHRRNVGYRDQRTAQRFEGRDRTAARDGQNRELARGYDRAQPGSRAGGGGQAATRPGGSAAVQGRGAGSRPGGSGAGGSGAGGSGAMEGRAPGGRPGGSGAAQGPAPGNRGGGGAAPPARKSGKAAASGGRSDAFSGYGGGGATRQASQRGAASRGGQSLAGQSPGAQRAGARGGGAGGRGGPGGGGRGGRGGGGGGGHGRGR